MSPISNALVRPLADMTEGAPCSLVYFNRYRVPLRVGIHLVSYEGGANPLFARLHRTIGLFTLDGLGEIITVFMATCEDDAPRGVPFHRLETEEFKTYIRQSIIPLEWKRLSDEELGGPGCDLRVRHGVVRHSLVRSV